MNRDKKEKIAAVVLGGFLVAFFYDPEFPSNFWLE
jgi:hypothetical protein